MTNSAKIADALINQSRALLRMPAKARSAPLAPSDCPSSYVVPHVMSIAAHKAAFGAVNQPKE